MACKLPIHDPSLDKGDSVYTETEMTIVLQQCIANILRTNLEVLNHCISISVLLRRRIYYVCFIDKNKQKTEVQSS